MITQRDIAIERLFSFTMWLQNNGLVDEKTERLLREDLLREIDYYIPDEPLRAEQDYNFEDDDEIAAHDHAMAMGEEGA